MRTSKNIKSDWYSCNVCKLHLHHRNLEKHLELCNTEKSQFTVCRENDQMLLHYVADEIPSNLQHAVIHNKMFYSRALKRSKKLSERFPHLKGSFEDKIITLPLSVMKICKLKTGDLMILISKNDRQAVRMLWPSESTSSSDIGVSKGIIKLLSISSGDWIMCRSYVCKKLKATEISLCPLIDSPIYSETNFISYLHNCEVNNFYTIGCLLFIQYMGKSFEFLVSYVKGEDGEILTHDDISLFQNVTCDKNDSYEMEYNSKNDSLLCNTSSGDNLKIIQQNKERYQERLEEITDNLSFPNILSPSISHSTPVKLHDKCDAQFQSFNLSNLSLEQPHSISEDKNNFYCISTNTEIKIIETSTNINQENDTAHTFEAIGGITEDVNKLRKNIHRALKNSLSFKLASQPICALLAGPSGTGKTLIATSIGKENRCHFVSVIASELFKPTYGGSETTLNNIFDEAVKRAPSIIFIDDIHVLFSKTAGYENNLEFRLVHALANNMEKISHIKNPVFVIMATNQKEIVLLIMKKLKRIDYLIEVPIPTSVHREEILTKLLSKNKHSVTEAEIKKLAAEAHGYVGADFVSICQIATMEAYNKNGTIELSEETIAVDRDKLKQTTISVEDLIFAFNHVKPSALGDLSLEVPKVHWFDIGGQEEVKKCLYDVTELPLKYPEIFIRHGVSPPSGILMYGPPGCSKTLIAKAVATESGFNFLAVKGPELFNKWVGESEKALKEIYRKAKAVAPCVIFFDEIDAFACERESYGSSQVGYRLVTQLLTEMSGISPLEKVITLAATNTPDRIDAALLRPGRFDYLLYIPLPNSSARREIFQIQFRKLKVGSDVDIETLVLITERYSGAEIVAICREAVDCSLNEDSEKIQEIKWIHFEEALKIITPNTSKESVEFYEKFSSSISCK